MLLYLIYLSTLVLTPYATILHSNSGVTKPIRKHNALVIKSHVCSELAVQRASLAQTNGAYDVFLLLFAYDASLNDDDCKALLRRYSFHYSKVLFVDMNELFPTLYQDAKRIPWAKDEPQQSLGTLHDCAIEPLFRDYHYIWVFETDVWWIGSLLDVLKLNDVAHVETDFVCATGTDGTSFGPSWHARTERKWDDAFLQTHNLMLNDDDGCLVPAVRYSYNLLHYACNVTRLSRVYFFSELWAPLMCKSLEGCVSGRLTKETTACHFNWAPPKGVAGDLCTTDMYKQKCGHQHVAQLVHPLKFLIPK